MVLQMNSSLVLLMFVDLEVMIQSSGFHYLTCLLGLVLVKDTYVSPTHVFFVLFWLIRTALTDCA